MGTSGLKLNFVIGYERTSGWKSQAFPFGSFLYMTSIVLLIMEEVKM